MTSEKAPIPRTRKLASARRGVILPPGFFFNCAHDDEALEITEEAVRGSFAVIKEGLENNRLRELLEVPPQDDLFRRLVR